MIATEYQPLARRTLKEFPREQHFIHMALGLCGEMGEFIDAIKKHVVYGKPLDRVNLTEEAGDDFWYGANLLPEMGVSPEVLQREIDRGHVQGTREGIKIASDPWEQAKTLLTLNVGVAAIAAQIANSPEQFEIGSSAAVKVIESIGGLLGTLCGIFMLDPAEALDLNIKKLRHRYGEKYSDLAALNRDAAGERNILEGNG